MSNVGKIVAGVILAAGLIAVLVAVLNNKKETGVQTMSYHVYNLDTQEEVAESPFATKAEAVGRVAWVADPPGAFIPSGYKVTKDGESAQPCAFRNLANGFQVAECEECTRTSKPDIDAVQTWLGNHLP